MFCRATNDQARCEASRSTPLPIIVQELISENLATRDFKVQHQRRVWRDVSQMRVAEANGGAGFIAGERNASVEGEAGKNIF